MYVSQTLKYMTEEKISKESGMCNEQETNRFNSFKIYSVHDVMNQMIHFQEVLSAVVLKYNSPFKKLYICQRNNPRTCLLYLVTFRDSEGFNKCGMWYAPLEISIANVNDELSQEQIHNLSSDFAILIPCVSHNSDLKSCYSVIFKSWTYRNRNNDNSLPRISKRLFKNTFHK